MSSELNDLRSVRLNQVIADDLAALESSEAPGHDEAIGRHRKRRDEQEASLADQGQGRAAKEGLAGRPAPPGLTDALLATIPPTLRATLATSLAMGLTGLAAWWLPAEERQRAATTAVSVFEDSAMLTEDDPTPEDDQAIAKWTEVIRNKPDCAPAYVNRGAAHLDLRQFDQAVEDFTRAIQLDPENAYFSYANRGEAYRCMGKFEESIADCTAAIQLDDTDARIFYHRGLAYGTMGQLAEARADFDQAIKLDADYAEAYSGRGFTHLRMGQHDMAIADCSKAIQLDPQHANAFGHRASAYMAQGKYDLAVSDYTAAIRIAPNSPLGYSRRGYVHLRRKDYAAAVADLSDVIRLGVKDAGTYYNRGLAYMQNEEFDKALADLSEAIRLNPQDPKARRRRAWVHQKQKNYDDAIADYSEAIQLDAHDASAYSGRGGAYLSNEEFDKAASDFAEAIRLNPEDSYAYDRFAWLRATCPKADLRDGKQALEYAEKACELTGWKDASHFKPLAAAYAELGRFDEAVKWQKKFLESGGCSTDETDEMRSRLKQFEAGKPFRDE
jgi:tetratricopeptide (TPR) repeat protein